jgi:hypothetical protein
MKTLKDKLFLGLIVIAIFATALAIFSMNSNKALGSVAVSNEYLATTTDATWSGATTSGDCKADIAGGMASSTVLGSIIVSSTSNADIYVYDATTTRSHGAHATTTIAAFPNVVAGTYTFDVALKRGLCVIVTTTEGVASTTITYRNN